MFRALVYNKGAAVLHMLRRLLGDEVFFRGLRRFYADRRYQKAGTEDFERAMEAESGRVLDRFFERWIYGTDIPRVRYSTADRRQARSSCDSSRPADLVFDLPVTVTLTYANGRTTDVVVPVTEASVERVHSHRRPRPPGAGQPGFGGAGGVRGRVGEPTEPRDMIDRLWKRSR